MPSSKAFRKLLRMIKVVQSFSAPGQPHDNAVMESFFSFMKREEIYRTQYKSEDEFLKAIMGQSAKVADNDRARKQRELDGLLARDKELDGLFERLYEKDVCCKG